MSSSSSSTFSSSSKNDYSKIITVQRDYFQSGATVPLSARKARLATLKKLLEENTDELAHAIERDLHKKSGYTQMELLGCLGEIDYVTSSLESWSATEYVSKTLLNAMDEPSLVRQPLGVVLIIGPWNYPLELVVRPLIPALAAGNTAVIKPSEVSSHTAAAIAKIFPKYFPPEVVSIISGGIDETTLLLKERFDHIFYTGSTPVGKIVMAAAAQHLTPVTLELGGKCPAVVLTDAKMEVTAARLAWGKWTNAGQTCVAPDYILVTEENKQQLVDEMSKQLIVFYGKDIKESKDYGRIINRRHFDRLSSLLTGSTGTLLYSGGELDPDTLFFPPTVIEVSKDDILMRDEIFGPILPIVTVRDLSEAIHFINSKEHALAAYIFTTEHRQSDRFVQETYSGGVCINDLIVHILVDTLPFGGVGYSGMGRYHGKFGFDTFTHQKPVLKRGFFGESLMAVRYPPMTEQKIEMFKGLTVRRQLPRFLNWIGRIPYWFCD